MLVLVALDPNVRAQVWRQAATSPSVHLADTSQQASHIAHILFAAVRDQPFGSAVAFALTFVVLALLMASLRSAARVTTVRLRSPSLSEVEGREML